MGQVEQRLAAVLEKERREAIGYTVLTVLCTPAFVALASLTMFLVFAHVFQYKRDSLDPSSVYMGLNFFLAYMLVFVLRQSNPPDEPHEFDKMWLAGVVVFLVLLILTYATPLREALPVFFGIVCTIMSFSVLGLLGRVQMPSPPTEDFEHRNFVVLLVLAVSGFIVMSYGEITRSSWLWFPPKPDEVRLGAWILCKLAAEKTGSLDSRAVQGRVLSVLSRLKLVQVKEDKLTLTSKGWTLLEPAEPSPSRA